MIRAPSEETPVALSALHTSKMHSAGLKHHVRKMGSYLRNEQTWQKNQGSSQQEAQGELIRTTLYRIEMVIRTCSATVYVSYHRSEGRTWVGSQAQQGNEDA